MAPPAAERVLVVGAGISGLTAAYRLTQQGFDVTVLEGADEVGGRMISTRRDGFTINRAAGIIPGAYTRLLELVDELGLGDRVRRVDTQIAIPRDGRSRRLRANGLGMLVDGVRTDLLSWRSKLLLARLVGDAFRLRGALRYDDAAAGAPHDTETVGDYCRRRLNPELREYVVDPLMRGFFTVEAEELSALDLLFAIVRILGRGQMSYEGGIDFLCRALAERVDVVTGAQVRQVERVAGGVSVTWTRDGEERAQTVAGCVLAVPGPAMPAIHPGLDPVQREIVLERIGFNGIVVGHYALCARPAEPALLTAFPYCERPELGLVVFHDVTSPDCVPPGKGLVSGYSMKAWADERAALGDEELAAELLAVMERVVPGIGDLVEFSYMDRWYPVVLNSYRGLYRDLAEFRARIDAHDRVQLAGDYFGYGSTNRCLITGEQAAQRLAGAIEGGRPWPQRHPRASTGADGSSSRSRRGPAPPATSRSSGGPWSAVRSSRS